MIFCHGSSNGFRCSPSSLSFIPSTDSPAPEVPDFPVAIPPSAGPSEDSRQDPCLGAALSPLGQPKPRVALPQPATPANAHTHTHTHMHTHTHARAQTRTLIHADRYTHNAHLHTYTHTETCTHTSARAHSYTCPQLHSHTLLHILAHVNTQSCTRTHMHILIHKHSHMQTHSYMCTHTNIHAFHKHLPPTPLTYDTHTHPAKDAPSWLLATP